VEYRFCILQEFDEQVNGLNLVLCRNGT